MIQPSSSGGLGTVKDVPLSMRLLEIWRYRMVVSDSHCEAEEAYSHRPAEPFSAILADENKPVRVSLPLGHCKMTAFAIVFLCDLA